MSLLSPLSSYHNFYATTQLVLEKLSTHPLKCIYMRPLAGGSVGVDRTSKRLHSDVGGDDQVRRTALASVLDLSSGQCVVQNGKLCLKEQ